MSTTHLSEAEKSKRREFVRDLRAANQQRTTVEDRAKSRETSATEWAAWLHRKMDESGCTDPTELLPYILAKVEQTIDDRVAAAIADIKQTFRKALS
jgi:hypothetical protein